MKLDHNWKVDAINEYFPSLHNGFENLGFVDKKLKTLGTKAICVAFLEIPNMDLP
jgi:hypothetical protein